MKKNLTILRQLQLIFFLLAVCFSQFVLADKSAGTDSCVVTYKAPKNIKPLEFDNPPVLNKLTECILIFRTSGPLIKSKKSTALHGNAEGWRELADIIIEVKKRSMLEVLNAQKIIKAGSTYEFQENPKVLIYEKSLQSGNLIIADYSALSNTIPYANKGRLLTQFIAGDDKYSIEFKYWQNPNKKVEKLELAQLKELFYSMSFSQ